ncbi:MAG: hypothetical protein R3Y54_04975, partial [Eubacteriales bacterium]
MAKFCKHCGTQLEEGMNCNCTGAQGEIGQQPQTPIQQTPIQQTPIQQTPIQQTPIQQTPIQQTPIQQA